DADETRRMSGGKRNTRGTPQGGVASPLLANIYMNRFLKHWRLTESGDTFRAHVVSYADDFVILSRGCAAEALAWTKVVMTKLGLTINEAKTSLRMSAQVPRAKAQGARARQSSVHIRCHSSRTRRSVPPAPAQSGPVACLAVKTGGKPDAGNRIVRFDERGRETGRWP